ncbi:ATP-dependent DNA helicase SRS2 [Spathaspora sp. JA1]|nr:ATP-dependent DNA helicase SRS2 [Spathaspora sp. JA1]
MATSTSNHSHGIVNILHTLNANQRQAVTSPPISKLQIIAGPGTGKTKVLTSRVAFLLLEGKIPAEDIIVTTFTKKAANEMIERLTNMLPDINLDKLKIGTFHSICFKLIMKHGGKLGLSGFTIADERDKDFYIKEMLSELTSIEVSSFSPHDMNQFKGKKSFPKYHDLSPKIVSSQISHLKSKGITWDKYSKEKEYNACLDLFYTKYQNKLLRNKVLDFDDCLLACHELISKFPLTNIQHILVDEFQDTNEIQLQLMYKLSSNVTIVGDPDQCIYSFRNAQVINFQKMIDHYQGKQQSVDIITLDNNYRSTHDILGFSETIMKQEQDRKTKQLISQHAKTFGSPVYAQLASDIQESKWVVSQITTLLSLPNQLLHPQDMAILVRSAYQTRVIETELNRQGIPYHMIRGRAFWDRKEVVVMMDYLRIIANENDRVAILRTINYPKRGIGEKTLEKIDEFLRLVDSNSTVYEKLLTISEVKLSTKVKSNVNVYLKFISQAKEKLQAIGDDETKLVGLFDFISKESGLIKELETPTEIENIDEIKKVIGQFVPPPQDEDVPYRNILGQFLDSIGLNETIEEQQQHSNHPKYKGRVSISTIHGAKGLEWPIVFVPGLSEGLLPSNMALRDNEVTSINEERRCLYVAVTRAKLLLYISWYVESETDDNEQSWRMKISEPSRFINFIKNKGNVVSGFSQDSLKTLYEMLGKSYPSEFDFNKFHQAYLAKIESIISNFDGSRRRRRSNEFEDFTNIGFTEATNIHNRKKNTINHFLNRKAPRIHPLMKPSVNNKAPAYIPTRTGISLGTKPRSKAPPYIPNRSKKIP